MLSRTPLTRPVLPVTVAMFVALAWWRWDPPLRAQPADPIGPIAWGQPLDEIGRGEFHEMHPAWQRADIEADRALVEQVARLHDALSSIDARLERDARAAEALHAAVVELAGLSETTASATRHIREAVARGLEGIRLEVERLTRHVAAAAVEPADEPARLSINDAEAAQLARLPGVGSVLAARIISHRQNHGPFSSLEQLLDVPGIGPATLAKIRPYLTTSQPDQATPDPAGEPVEPTAPMRRGSDGG